MIIDLLRIDLLRINLNFLNGELWALPDKAYRGQIAVCGIRLLL